MKFKVCVLILIINMLIMVNCFYLGQSVPIKNIRFEGIAINNVFLKDKPAENIRAFWKESEVLVYYDTTNIITNETSTIELIFKRKDEHLYSTYSGQHGNIFSQNNKLLSYKEISDLPESEKNNLLFIIFDTDKDSPYYNMVLIPGGTFTMGSRKTLDEIPMHRVSLNNFYIDKYEVTVEEFIKFCTATRRSYPRQPSWNKDNHPVVNVSWEDANAYAKWVGKRLPTEAEWEYAARSGEKGNWFAWGNRQPAGKTGDNIADEAVRSEYSSWNYWEGFYDGFVYTSPVGSFSPNHFGIYDMGGNVKEWCADWYDKNYYKKSPKLNPKGPEKGSRRVLRGGSWNYGPGDVRLTKRYRFKSTLKLNYIGFRCVKDVE